MVPSGLAEKSWFSIDNSVKPVILYKLMDNSKKQAPKSMPFDPPRPEINSNCPSCEAKFDPRRSMVIDESRAGVLFHLTCGNCHTSLLAVVAVSRLGVNAFGMVTDLTADDVRRMRRGARVNQDDVLKAYREFINFSGIIK